MKIDAHTHIDRAGGKDWTADQLISSMDEAGIDMSLVISNTINNAPLDKMLEIAKSQPRFKIIGHVDFSALDNKQIERLQIHLKNKEIVGVKLYPGYENFYPDDKNLFPIFEYCQKNNHPIVIHTGIVMIGVQSKNKPGFLEQTHPFCVDRIATQFPDLKIVMAHVGNPWIMDAAAVVARNKNVYVDLSGYFTEFVEKIPDEEIEIFLRQMKDFKIFAGIKKVIFGTDWPLYNQKNYLEVVRKIPMTEQENDLMLWKNANNVYNLGR